MSDDLEVAGILKVLNEGATSLESISVFESVDSTNDWCLRKCKESKALPFACIADVQDKGKGRRGHHWVSSTGSSITMSFATTFKLEMNQLGMLSLAIGMAVADVLRSLGIKGVMLKWPNDVMVSNQKIAGILIEAVIVGGRLNVVVGVGVNYDMTEKQENIENAWTDVAQCLKKKLDGGRTWLAGSLLHACLDMCKRYQVDFDSISAEFDSRYNAFVDEAVKVIVNGGNVVYGTCIGTSTTGEIKVLVDGEEQVFSSAEISLRRAVEC